MRKKMIEEIRRMIGRTISMCDLSSLDSTKKRLLEAVRELDLVESRQENKNKKTSAERTANRFPNPTASLALLDAEIKKETDNLSDAKNQLLSE